MQSQQTSFLARNDHACAFAECELQHVLGESLLRRHGSDSDEHFPQISSGEQLCVCGEYVLESVRDIEVHADLVALQPASHDDIDLRPARQEVRCEEAANGESPHEDLIEACRAERRSIGAVTRDETANGNATVQCHVGQHRIEQWPADIVEVDVDAAIDYGEHGRNILVLVVDHDIEADLITQKCAFLRATREQKCASAHELRDLRR